MTSVHGITVFGGTFPAEIWNSLYSGAEIPCEEFSEPETPISWAPFFGQYTRPAARGSSASRPKKAKTASRGRAGRGRRLRPQRVRAGRGQEPTPAPAPAPARRAAAAAAAGVGGGPKPAGSGLAEPPGRRRGRRPRVCRLLAASRWSRRGRDWSPAAGGGGPDWLLGVYGDGSGSGRAPTTRSSGWLRRLSLRSGRGAGARSPLVRGAAVVLVVAFALAPPLLSQDVFSYIAYARLGALHGLNPYIQPPTPPTSFAHVELDRIDELLRPAVHARDLSARPALGAGARSGC